MENKSWTVTYRNRDNGQRITAAVFAVDQQQAREKAKADGREAWEVESIEPNEETLARILIAEFAKKQSGHFACPRCGQCHQLKTGAFVFIIKILIIPKNP